MFAWCNTLLSAPSRAPPEWFNPRRAFVQQRVPPNVRAHCAILQKLCNTSAHCSSGAIRRQCCATVYSTPTLLGTWYNSPRTLCVSGAILGVCATLEPPDVRVVQHSLISTFPSASRVVQPSPSVCATTGSSQRSRALCNTSEIVQHFRPLF
jgi:hypothetical protein